MNRANLCLPARLLSFCAIALLTAVFFTPAAPTQEAGKLLDLSGTLQTTDTTDEGDASFERSDGRYTINARGGFYKDGEAYGSVYVPDAFRSRMNVQVTVEQQEAVREWTKTGLKVASDITDAGGSKGDLIMVATPKHGYSMALDTDRDGDTEGVAKAKVETRFPVVMKLERAGDFITGYYSHDGGESFSKVGTAKLPEPDQAMDVGMVQASSRPKSLGKAVFSGFQIRNTAAIKPVMKPDPLPKNAEVLDRLIFGNKPSEQRHGLAPESSWLTRGKYGTICRELQRVIPGKDVPYEWTIGSMSFKMKVKPDELNFLTLKLQQDTSTFAPAPMALFYGDEQIGYMNGREGYSTPGNLYRGQGQTGNWVYATSALPQSITEGKQSVRLRVVAYDPHGGPMSDYIGTDVPVYRAYTHTEALFGFPSDENPFKRYAGSPGGNGKPGNIDRAMATIKSNVEAAVKSALDKDQVGELVAEHLARASKRDWIETADRDQIYKVVLETIDRHIRTWEKQDRKMIHDGCWRCNGNLAGAFNIMSDEFKKRGVLHEPIPNSPNDDPRGKVYTDFFVNAYQSRQNDRNVITNQVQIATYAVIKLGLALDKLTPARAPRDMKIKGWIDQTIGIEPLTKLPGETGHPGPNWRTPAYFRWKNGHYAIHARGGLYKDGEAYGAIYAPDAFESGMTAGVTLEQQENTDQWAKAGLKIATDITRAGESPGDLVLYSTPNEGYKMAVDKNQDGSVEGVADGSSKTKKTYPVTFMIKSDGAKVTGFYSNNRGKSFEKIGTTTLPEPPEAMDVGMFQASTKSNKPGRSVFSGFRMVRNGDSFEPKTQPQPIATAEEINASNGNGQLKVVDTTDQGGLMFTLSGAGLNREPRYASGHGSIPNIMLSSMAQELDYKAVDERLLDHVEAMGWFRWVGASGAERKVLQNNLLSSRATGFPGDTGIPVAYSRAPSVLAAVEEPNEMIKRWTELMVKYVPDVTMYDRDYKRATRLNNMMPMYDGLKRLKKLEPSTYKLPWERERAVWGDPDQGMVSITDGDVRIQACLGMNHGTHISNIAKFGVLAPDGHRVGTVPLRRREFPLHRMVERPNSRVTFRRGIDYDTGDTHDTPFYMPWRDERRQINLYRRGQKVPLASRPNGNPWPKADKYPEKHSRADLSVGFTYYYREARIGPYLIGINSTGAPKRAAGPAQKFEMKVPGQGAVDVATGKKIKSDTITVGPRQTRVLKIID